MQTAPQTQADLSVLGHGVRAGLQLHKDCSEECGAGLLSLRVCCICRHPQHLPGDMGVELQVPNVRGRPMLRQRQRCGRKVALLRLLLGVPAAQSVLAVQSWAPYFHNKGVAPLEQVDMSVYLERVQIVVPAHACSKTG